MAATPVIDVLECAAEAAYAKYWEGCNVAFTPPWNEASEPVKKIWRDVQRAALNAAIDAQRKIKAQQNDET